jgi:hypothetical protein
MPTSFTSFNVLHTSFMKDDRTHLLHLLHLLPLMKEVEVKEVEVARSEDLLQADLLHGGHVSLNASSGSL